MVKKDKNEIYIQHPDDSKTQLAYRNGDDWVFVVQKRDIKNGALPLNFTAVKHLQSKKKDIIWVETRIGEIPINLIIIPMSLLLKQDVEGENILYNDNNLTIDNNSTKFTTPK